MRKRTKLNEREREREGEKGERERLVNDEVVCRILLFHNNEHM